jgi:uncharacterized protein
MLLLLNTTKTMNLKGSVPPGMDVTEPCFLDKAQLLTRKVSKMSTSQLADLMSLSDKLAAETFDKISLWGKDGQPQTPALFGFTGLLYKHLDASSLNKDQLDTARKRVRILSGLYGLLNPFDMIESYRFEMGLKLNVGNTKNMAAFWKEILTAKINTNLKAGEPIISVASQEYMSALDIKKLNGPVISPVFKEQVSGSKYRSAVVHAKKARGALVRYALENKVEQPKDLMGFNAMGWRAVHEPPEKGNWLFTRPAGS